MAADSVGEVRCRNFEVTMNARIFLWLLAVLVDISAGNKEFYRPLNDSAKRAHVP
jgi:hypothetical protein